MGSNHDRSPPSSSPSSSTTFMPRAPILPWSQILTSVNVIVFALVHLSCLLVFYTGYQHKYLCLMTSTYLIRMFGITAGYHRYFAHRAYKTSRMFQFVLALVGASSWQKGVLWWASWHRHHHQTADTIQDAHTPKKGFWYSHFGWFLCTDEHTEILWKLIPDLSRYQELVVLEQYHFVPGLILASMCYVYQGFGGLIWGFMLSTTLLWHATFTINSLSHMYGSQRYACQFHSNCDARNNVLLAIITLGEGWHNNHHSAMRSVRQGLMWYEIDISFYMLWCMRLLGIVFGFSDPPYAELEHRKLDNKKCCGNHTIHGHDVRELYQSANFTTCDSMDDQAFLLQSTCKPVLMQDICDLPAPRDDITK